MGLCPLLLFRPKHILPKSPTREVTGLAPYLCYGEGREAEKQAMSRGCLLEVNLFKQVLAPFLPPYEAARGREEKAQLWEEKPPQAMVSASQVRCRWVF